MNNNIIPFALLKESDVLECITSRKYNVNYYDITLINRGGHCPSCGLFTKKIKGYTKKKISHSIYQTEDCYIVLNHRRLICHNCNKTFYENNPFVEDYKSISSITVKNTLVHLKNYNQTFASVARTVGLSKTKVMEIFDEHIQVKRHALPEFLCVDEIYFSRKAQSKYNLVLMNFNNGLIIDMLESRHKNKINSYLRNIPLTERNKVKYICIDMNSTYLEVFRFWFPNALICVDSFHVIKLIQSSLDEIRLNALRKFQNKKTSDEYYLLKFRRKLLYQEVQYDSHKTPRYNHHFRYRVTEKRELELLLAIDKDLKKAYELKERYLYCNRTLRNDDEVVDQINEIINSFIDSGIPSMVKVGQTLDRWKEYIINSFHLISNKNTKRRISNGPIEGRNKYLKIILKLANGYSNFKRFRNRCMYVLNKHESYSTVKLPNNIKRRYP